MLHNDTNMDVIQQKESYKIAIKTIAISVLFSVLSLIVISTGIMEMKIERLFLAILFFVVFTSFMLASVYFFKLTNPWVKYAIIVVLSLGVSIVNIFCRINKLNVVWIYAVILSNLFFSKKANWFSIIFQMFTLIISDYIAFNYFPQNFYGSTPWSVLVISNGIQFIIISLFCVAVNYKIMLLLQKMKRSEKEKDENLVKLDKILKQSSNVSNELSDSINQISEVATKSEELNTETAIGIEHLLENYENTLLDMDYVLQTTEIIMEKNSSISQKGETISDIFNQEDTMNDSVEVIIDNAVKLMQSIEDSTKEGMELIDLIHQKSLSVMSTLELIKETVEKIGSLSLSANIEASRAGDFQDGFEVVAYDIKKLGERAEKESQIIFSLTKDTVSEIEFACQSIEEDINCIQIGQDTIKNVEELFKKASIENKNVNNHIQDVNDNIRFIADSDINISELVKVLKEMSVENIKGLKGISELTNEQNESFDEFIEALKSMENVTQDLKNFIEPL